MKPRQALKWAALLLVTSGSLVVAPAKPPVPPAARPEVAVYLDFEHEPSEMAIDEMKREVGSILEPVGLRLQWRLLDNDYISENFDELAVMRFTGQCRGSFPLVRSGGAALGESVVSEGEVLAFGAVECDHVRRMIFDQTRGEPSCEAFFGRALGRVLAHELYHMLTRTTLHATAGVAKPFYTREDLLQKRIAFGRKELDRLRHALPTARRMVQTPPPAPNAPAEIFD